MKLQAEDTLPARKLRRSVSKHKTVKKSRVLCWPKRPTLQVRLLQNGVWLGLRVPQGVGNVTP